MADSISLSLRLLDVVGADALEHVAEQVELTVGVGRGGLGAGAEADFDQSRLRRHQRQGDTRNRTKKNQ